MKVSTKRVLLVGGVAAGVAVVAGIAAYAAGKSSGGGAQGQQGPKPVTLTPGHRYSLASTNPILVTAVAQGTPAVLQYLAPLFVTGIVSATSGNGTATVVFDYTGAAYTGPSPLGAGDVFTDMGLSPQGQGGGGPQPHPHPTFCQVSFTTSTAGPYDAIVCLDGSVHIQASLDWGIVDPKADTSVLQFLDVSGGAFHWKVVGRGSTKIRLNNARTDINQDFTITVP